ncbi:MAG: acetyl-CoA decarbonylase/synthase complex subunit gamma [Candidatus Omnitrophota bacterium]
MGLSGLDIYKLLPKTNCRECGYSNCLAFALAIAKKAVSIDKCPHISKDVKQKLLEAVLPAMKLIEIGINDRKSLTGQETVLFRHEEKFHNPCLLGYILDDNLNEEEFDKRLLDISNIKFERVGEIIKLDLIALRNKSNNSEKFKNCIKKIALLSNLNIVIITDNLQILKESIDIIKSNNALIYFTKDLTDTNVLDLLKKYNPPIVISADRLEEFDNIIPKLIDIGLNNLVLETKSKNVQNKLWDLTQIRRLALKKKNRAFGFPQLVTVKKDDDFSGVMQAATFITKYANVILLENFGLEDIFALLTLRQNIYSDPQKPLQVEPKAYAIGQVTDNSPVLVTTNFSLTYYTVLSEVEASKIPSYIAAINTEGMSVLTAWAAEKFTPESITKGINDYAIKDKVKHNKIIIPGYVANMNKHLEDLSKTKVIVGPKEASGIPSLLKSLYK